MKILKAILNIIYPKYCINCNIANIDICDSCLSLAKLNQKETESYIYTIYDYKDPIVKKIIHSFKYKNRKDLKKTIGEILYAKIIEELYDLKTFKNFNNIILIPIPLSKKRQRERTYNQSMLIVKEIIKLDKNKNFILGKNILIKNKNTKHQANIKNRKERLKNVIGTFSVINKEKIKNKNIILIDDVITTGATLKEARKELKKSGAKRVIAFTLAH